MSPETIPEPPTPPTPKPLSLRSMLSFRNLVHAVFWSWHAVWVLAVVFGLGTQLLPGLLVATAEGLIPWDITLCAIALMVLPVFTLLAGWRLRHDHQRLFGLFYGVAGVGFTLLVVRLFLIREITTAVAMLLLTLAAGAAFFAAELFGRRPAQGLAAESVTLVGYTALLLIGAWVGVTMGIFFLPVLGLIAQKLPQGLLELLNDPPGWDQLVHLPIILAMMGFGACCAAVVVTLPFALAWIYPRAWWQQLQRWRARRSLASGLASSGAAVAVWLGAFAWGNQQPQHDAFARVESVPRDLEAQADNLAHAESIRAGLLNAALAPYRYWGSTGGERPIAELYDEAFGFDAQAAQALFDVLAIPLLYQGEALHADRRRAEIAYERFFDRPLQDGDRAAMVTAMTATWDRSDVEAGLLDVGNRNVLLSEQELSRTIDGDIARFELHEVYRNETHEVQEVFYYFELPERAAVTGLWLGDGPDRGQRFEYTVAPRGAAQAVYRQQRQQRIDPALLEQVGPRQYRMRVFPVPAIGAAQKSMHLWLEWSVLADAHGGWPLPRLAEARNVYWDADDTIRTIDGAGSDHDGWLPLRIDGDARPRTHELTIAGHVVRATPTVADPRRVPGRIAVVVDTSLSMATHAGEVRQALDRLAAMGPELDVYVAPSPWSAERPRRVELAELEPHYYGGHSHAGVLADFMRVRERADHAAVIVLSDAGSFAFLQDDAATAAWDPTGAGLSAAARARADLELLGSQAWTQPVWMLHFGGLPHAYRDQLTDLLRRTGGGVATELDTVLVRMTSDVVDGYTWEIGDAPKGDRSAGDDPFAPIAAAALIAELGGRGADLDHVHAIAKLHAVVTPWSSMIVLVDDAQREALRKASEADDRFDREAESGVESTTTPGAGLDVDATPEPHEWMLLALALLGLLAVARAKPQPRLC
ncbi:MAG: TIGR02921 family PEP-CTERM protein [Deltaproteobacteria bacterium]|nr:TIGR02921 family PEP-CTERM protein [Nannocystaceae bacterium]